MKSKKLFSYRLKKPPILGVWAKSALYLGTVLSAGIAILCAVLQVMPDAVNIVCYVLAALFMLVGGYYFAQDIYSVVQFTKEKIYTNPYTGKVAGDYRLKTMTFAVPGLVSNLLFACFHGVLGVVYHSAWFGSLAAYYIVLSAMRINIVWQERRITQIAQPEERMRREYIVYRRSSALFIVLSVVLGGMVILLIASEGGSYYPGFAIYAVAAYVFYKLIRSFMHIVKAAKYQSPLLMIMRKIGNIDAWTSLLTLQTAMFAAFGGEEAAMISGMNGLTGILVSLIILGMGIQGLLHVREWEMQRKNDNE